MISEKEIVQLVSDMKDRGCTKTEIIIEAAEAELGWCYVWGATGQQCTPANRRAYAGRSSCPAGESSETLNKCQVTRPNNPQSSCAGCQWYPDGKRTLMDDCQGFIKQTAGRVGIRFSGGGCTSMWNNMDNWHSRGTIGTLPEQLCCVFWQNSKDKKTMEHIGWYIGNGMMIHCSGKVKKEKLSAKCTHWAIPKALEGGELPVTLPTLRKGSSGEYVTKMQTMLIQQGYDLAPYGADGKFGNKTQQALIKFQNDHGLTPDGICGERTWAALQDVKTELYTVTITHVSKTVAEGIIHTYGGTMTAEGVG